MMSQEPKVRPLQLVTAEELAELGWQKPRHAVWCPRTRREDDGCVCGRHSGPPAVVLRLRPEPPEAA